MLKKAIFLDRDGVLNKKAAEHEYITNVHEFQWIPQAKQLIKYINDQLWYVFIVTNQQGIGKGKMSIENVQEIHDKIQDDLTQIGAHIDAFFICPHLQAENCNCRKPLPGLILQAFEQFTDIDKENSLLIGDSKTDIAAAEAVGIKALKIESDGLSHERTEIMSFLSHN